MNEKIFSLPVIEQISPYLSRRQLGELPILVISHPKVRAAISLQGAHLIAWQPAQTHPVLWLSEDALFTPGVAIRGGIPICWPWLPQREPQAMDLHVSYLGNLVLILNKKTECLSP